MRYKLALAAACFAASTLAIPAASSAATVSPVQSTAVQSKASLVEAAQWRRPWRGRWGRCRAWRRECGARWGWGGFRYRRCMRRHGC